MNIAGVVKDWLLIGLSVLLYQSPISRVNLGGYSIAFVSVQSLTPASHPFMICRCSRDLHLGGSAHDRQSMCGVRALLQLALRS